MASRVLIVVWSIATIFFLSWPRGVEGKCSRLPSGNCWVNCMQEIFDIICNGVTAEMVASDIRVFSGTTQELRLYIWSSPNITRLSANVFSSVAGESQNRSKNYRTEDRAWAIAGKQFVILSKTAADATRSILSWIRAWKTTIPKMKNSRVMACRGMFNGSTADENRRGACRLLEMNTFCIRRRKSEFFTLFIGFILVELTFGHCQSSKKKSCAIYPEFYP